MIKFSGDSKYFNVDEQSILNRLAIDLSKDEFLEQLTVTIDLCDDEDCISLMEDVKDKVNELTVSEWNDLQLYLPFELPYSDADFLEEA